MYILLMTGWRADAACRYIRHRADAMRAVLPITERLAGECLRSVMELEAMR